MMSLAAVESAGRRTVAGRALGRRSSVPDAKKGERLVLLTDAPDATRAEFLRFRQVEGRHGYDGAGRGAGVGKVPVLGSGKVDFARKAKSKEEHSEQAIKQRSRRARSLKAGRNSKLLDIKCHDD